MRHMITAAAVAAAVLLTPAAAAAATATGVPAGNTIWNGYVTKFSNTTKATAVKASWQVPSLTGCTNGPSAAQWIGLGGVSTSSVNSPGPVQIGTESYCDLGIQVNYAVWEIRPGQSGVQLISTGRVTAGDYIDAHVKFLGRGKYRISLTDNSWEWTFAKTVTQPASSAAPKMAEWIIEAGGPPLADFGSAQYTECFWNAGKGLGPLVKAVKYEAGTSRGNETSVSTISQYGGAGPNFTETWLRP